MKKINVEHAVGMALCHDITKMVDGFKGAAFQRGHVITEEDIPKLLDLGKRTVFIWEENAGEVHEEDAALRMAAMCPVSGAHYTAPSEGKVLLMADVRGMLRVDTALLTEINNIGDITIATLPDHYPVEAGARLASMRIIPLVTREENIARAEALCAHKALIKLLPYKHKRIGVIITGSEVYSGRITDKFEPVIRKKMSAFPSEIVDVTICDDDLEMIVSAAKKQLSMGADMLIFTGGMSVDPDDLTPAAVKQLGAEIITHGVPSQPGNMTLVAYIGDIPVLGVPGAAVSLPTTVLDVLLPQLFTDEKLTFKDLAKLADGGLCQLCAACHYPNCTFGRY
ncbi:MAG: molybdopterin-binding protein [Oscillospiraceae bacterium]|nr:molybdopterin-binding protein [Oscillospiraceae bacterium]